jgi:hypothetical protein
MGRTRLETGFFGTFVIFIRSFQRREPVIQPLDARADANVLRKKTRASIPGKKAPDED